MCGLLLAGPLVTTDAFDRACALIAHRGTRCTTKDLDWGVRMFHARLPIVGLGEEYDQPVDMAPVGLPSSHLMFVGELLNFRESFPDSQCDLEVVVRTWGDVKGFRNFDGFWSIVTYNSRTCTTYLLCDYLAQKPLYYRTDLLLVASEPQACAVMPTHPDELYLSDVVKWGYCPDPARTPYAEVRRVLPGQFLSLSNGGRVIVDEIVDPLVPNVLRDEGIDAKYWFQQELRRKIESAVRRRVLSSDVPVATLVSGGLDSAIVYTLASKYGTVHPYFVADADPIGEGQFLEYKNACSVIGPLAKDIPNLTLCYWNEPSIDDALRVMGEPLDLGSLIPQLALAQAIDEDVCLTGDGADEFFGGYGRSQRYDSQWSDVFRELVCWHLPRLDRVMMSNRVEVRSPFLARKVCELALALPRELRTGKRILKDLFRDDLPLGIADQPKVPLRTREVSQDREKWSHMLVDKFRQTTWRS